MNNLVMCFNKKLFKQIYRFLIIGIIAFIIDYLVLIFSKEVINLNIYLSTFIAFVVSVIFNYILSVKWVFNVKTKKSKKNFIFFIFFSIIGLIITEVIMFIGVTLIEFYYLIVKLFATVIVMVYNFITRKLFLEK